MIDISLSQFAKTITKARKNAKNDEDAEELFPEGEDVTIIEENDHDEEHEEPAINDINADFIIAYKDKDKKDKQKLKKFYKIDGVTMRRRKPLVLRFHKFKQTTEPHQFYFSQLRLYHPHSTTDLDKWETDMGL